MKAVVKAQTHTLEEELDIRCGELVLHLVQQELETTWANVYINGIVRGYRYDIVFKGTVVNTSASATTESQLGMELEKLTSMFTASLSGA